ncbi:SDR family oxidoreductase [Kutzneria kofuensis]|uniref:NAD(P)-dependent dehydrogenase (Short-subunit alcohol dehydrogenase family) n=1 Tax=Kutzneria kofuensis TaxID=103725 RepID=A0A7W9KDM5_9PSEU|nr:SDR family oxidoreductase [Kutzneria kofuensis]MBB5890515.1 NAD(P)-dependent dehydrogenase (short-subunit alcohol dehydrogenase family) [Kutzneria kofuensis]
MTLTDKKVLIVGGSSGIAAQLKSDLVAAGADVTLVGRRTSPALDLTDEDSIRRLASELGEVDHIVSLAAAHANGPVTELDRDAVHTALDAKIVGPILLAKHFASRIRPGGSILLFSGVAGWQPSPGLAVMATGNAAVATLAEALAVELAPVRVNALSPGIIDSGVWDGPGKEALFEDVASKNPARRVGQPSDVSAAALLALTNPFVTGTTLHIDGGARLA